jgi:hypothetical protein
MPTLITHYEVYSGGNNANTLTTPAFTPSNGEVLVVKLTTWDTGVSGGTPSGGGQTFTKNKEAAPGGFAAYAAVWTATVSGSPGSMTVSATPSGSAQHQMIVERWSNALLAATPAVNATGNGTGGAPAADIVTTAANSVVTWCEVDVNSDDPAGRAYRLSATEDGLYDGHVGANSVQYFAYASVGAAGTYTMGMTAPTPQNWVLAGVEILDNTAVNVSVTDGAGAARALAASDAVSAGVSVTDQAGAACALSATDAVSTGVTVADISPAARALAAADAVVTGASVSDTAGVLRALRSLDSVTVGGTGSVTVTDSPGVLRLLSAEDCWRTTSTIARPYSGLVDRPDSGSVCRP